MASVTGICNSALTKVGASVITSLNQGTKNAEFCNRRYAELRDALLEMHPWNFAVKSAKLAQLASTPAVRFDNAYQIPSDFIRAISIHDDDEGLSIPDYKFRDNTIECSASELWIIYISRETDPNRMSSLFREALAQLIAIEAATFIVESVPLREAMEKQFDSTLRRARSADSQSDLPDRMPVGSWTTIRSGRLASRKWSFQV